MKLPSTRPADDPAALWKLQHVLLGEAEALLGPRSPNVTIYQPVFSSMGPCLRNTPSLDGAFVELSRNAVGYWPTVVFELAHETIHLLDPTAGYTTWLEEGIAVAFSLEAQRVRRLRRYLPSRGPYLKALRMVNALPNSPFAAGRRVREVCGALNRVTPSALAKALPEVAHARLVRLASRCTARPL